MSDLQPQMVFATMHGNATLAGVHFVDLGIGVILLAACTGTKRGRNWASGTCTPGSCSQRHGFALFGSVVHDCFALERGVMPRRRRNPAWYDLRSHRGAGSRVGLLLESVQQTPDLPRDSPTTRVWLGSYDTTVEAACAYDAAVRTLRPGARTNLPEPAVVDKEERVAVVLAHVARVKRKREEKIEKEARLKTEEAAEATNAAAVSAVAPPPPAPAATEGDGSGSAQVDPDLAGGASASDTACTGSGRRRLCLPGRNGSGERRVRLQVRIPDFPVHGGTCSHPCATRLTFPNPTCHFASTCIPYSAISRLRRRQPKRGLPSCFHPCLPFIKIEEQKLQPNIHELIPAHC
ncbi:hypothetical protein EJB05_00184, partial [Eragrostis curvula]